MRRGEKIVVGSILAVCGVGIVVSFCGLLGMFDFHPPRAIITPAPEEMSKVTAEQVREAYRYNVGDAKYKGKRFLITAKMSKMFISHYDGYVVMWDEKGDPDVWVRVKMTDPTLKSIKLPATITFDAKCDGFRKWDNGIGFIDGQIYSHIIPK